MKLICDRPVLSEALAAISAVIVTRTPKPILQCVRLTADSDCLTLTAYDQEVGMRYRVTHVEVSKPGETLVMAERLTSIVRESTDETLALETADEVLHVRGRNAHYQIYGQNVREFPPVPDFEGEPDFRVPVSKLVAAVDRTVFSAARESTRYAINGVMWEWKGKKLQLVATDGRRLAWTGFSMEKAAASDGKAIVPVKTLNLLAKLRSEPDDVIDVKLEPNQLLLRTPRATISSVLVEGNFPNYEDVIPRDCTRTAEMSTQEFLSAVRQTALLTSEDSRGIRLSFGEEGLVLSSRVPEQGEARVQAEAKLKGSPIDIGFNPIYLMDALKVCQETVTLEMKEPSKPGVLRSGPEFLYVLMPLTLS